MTLPRVADERVINVMEAWNVIPTSLVIRVHWWGPDSVSWTTSCSISPRCLLSGINAEEERSIAKRFLRLGSLLERVRLWGLESQLGHASVTVTVWSVISDRTGWVPLLPASGGWGAEEGGDRRRPTTRNAWRSTRRTWTSGSVCSTSTSVASSTSSSTSSVPHVSCAQSFPHHDADAHYWSWLGLAPVSVCWSVS